MSFLQSTWLVLVVAVAASASGSGPQASAVRLAVAAPQTIPYTFTADADTRVHEAAPSTNYGTRTVLRVDGAGDPAIESYLRFTVTGLAAPVERAILRLHATTATVDGPSVAATSSDWGEITLTWSNRPAPTSAPVADAGAIAAGAWVDLDVTPLVPGDGTVSFVLVATHKDGVDFDSREVTGANLRPQLVVETSALGPPVATSPPTVTGTPQAGQTLTASPGTWSGSLPITFAYQWQRCTVSGAQCDDIGSATGQSYVLVPDDVGAAVRVGVTATNADGTSTAYSSATSSIAGDGDVVVAVAGDIAGCSWSADEATARLLDAIAPDRVLTLGDNVYPDGTAAEFASCYDPTWGRHRARTSPSVGNHEYHTPGAAGYFGYFGAAAGDPAKGYYAFDLGAWRLYALNSNCSEVSCAAGAAQEQWLRADLAQNPRSCRAAFLHHPRFASGTDNSRRDNNDLDPLYRAFSDASGDLWLAGHNHAYERLTRLDPSGAIDLQRGLRNFVVGTGGTGLTPFGTPNTGSEARSLTHGVLRLTLRADGYDWEFVPVAGATFTDAGTDTCTAAPADTNAPGAPGSLAAPSATAGNVELSWTAATDDLGVVSYRVDRNGSFLASTTATGFTDTSAVAGASYTYAVTAVDAAGNPSPPSTVGVTVTPASTAAVTFSPDADARVVEAKPTSNFGSASSLRVDGGTDPDIESYLRFTVAGVTGPVRRATLRLYAYTATVDGPSVSGTTTDWGEKAITWTNRPPATTGAVDDRAAIAGGTWVEYDVTSLVQGNGAVGFLLMTVSRDSVDFYSRETTQTALRPQLVVTYG